MTWTGFSTAAFFGATLCWSSAVLAQSSSDSDAWGKKVEDTDDKKDTAAQKKSKSKTTRKAAGKAIGSAKNTKAGESIKPASTSSKPIVSSTAPQSVWKNPHVAERAPNRYGQTGIKRITSASPGRSGDVDIGLHLRGFFSPDFLVPNNVDTNLFGAGSATLGFSLFDVVELGLATRFAGNENDEVTPNASYSLGDVAASVKAGLGFGPVFVGGDVRLLVPSTQTGILPDFQNVSARGLLLLTVDLYTAYDIPIRFHLNGGYTFQADRFAPDGPRDAYYANDAASHLTALAREQWFYDSVSGGVGLEVLLPFVTPYLEVWGQSAMLVRPDRGVGGGAYNFISDPHVIVTPGVRVTPLPGLNFDFAVDIGALGTAGYLQPDVTNVVNGQPINPLWAAQLSVSYTFQPFFDAPSTSRTASQTARAGGSGRGATSASGSSSGAGSGAGTKACLSAKDTSAPIEDAIIEFDDGGLARLASGSDGCFVAPVSDSGASATSLSVKVRHPDFESTSTVITAGKAGPKKIVMMPLLRKGEFKGFITNEKDKNVDATLKFSLDGEEVETIKTSDGAFSLKLNPGTYQAVVQAKGYLQQGAKVVVEKSGRTIRNFVLKRIPKRRISQIKKGKIAIRTRLPFAYSKARLLRAAEFILDDVVDVILSNPQLAKVRIEGHTDNTGDDAYNKKLSADRANAVKDYLIDKGVPAERLDAKGYGSKKPIARNDRESGRAKNRRVDFVIVDDTSTASSP